MDTRQHSVVEGMRLRDILAVNLRRLRNAAKLTQEELADLAEIDRSYVSELEGSKYAATVDMLDALASALQVEPIALLAKSSETS